MLRVKRIYERPEVTDGVRILVDRLWPRGVRRSTANIDMWLKEVGPSDELRKWYAHELNKYLTFRRKYLKELQDNPTFEEMVDIVRANDNITLLFATSNVAHNNAIVLAEAIKTALKKKGRRDMALKIKPSHVIGQLY